MFPALRFRRFRTRLLVLLVGLLVAALGTTYFVVTRANRANALEHINQSLTTSVRVFRFSIDARIQALADSARVVSADWPMRTLYLQEELDRGTLRSTLASYADRLNAPVVAAFTPEGDYLTATDMRLVESNSQPFQRLISQADTEGLEQVSDYAYVLDRLHMLVVVPIYAPRPNIIGWLGAAFPIDNRFAQDLKNTTQAEVSFISGREAAGTHLDATTLSPELAREVVKQIKNSGASSPTSTILVELEGEPYVTLVARLSPLGDNPARIALQRSLTAELAAAEELEEVILLVSLVALFAATIAALLIARGVSGPLHQLAAHADSVAAGDYSRHLTLVRQDELGHLATAFNHMSDGLADRDKVRDLLGKVVSREIAAQLLRSGVALGGEEREVTILFCDLRDFTAMSEKMAARDVLALLNRYLDRMSTIVEKHGGVVDKYIGDAIMALFGAPVATPNAAARAVAAAKEMVDSLEDLNRELEREGQPRLEFGIGINTAVVVAGNMGSKTRLNYTVIGDGVNLASRLEALTKKPEFATSIIVSEATAKACGERDRLRALATVTVKGKQEPIQIYAVDVADRPWSQVTGSPASPPSA